MSSSLVRGIFLSGKQRAGKSTVLRALHAALEAGGTTVHRMSWADPLKREEAEARGITVDELLAVKDGRDGIEAASDVRRALQTRGQARRVLDVNYWVDRGLTGLPEDPAVFVLNDDTRYPNEVERAREWGGLVVRVETPREAREARGILSNEDHESETALDDYAGFDVAVDGTRDPKVIAENLLVLVDILNGESEGFLFDE